MRKFFDPTSARAMVLRVILVTTATYLGACGRTPESFKRADMTSLSPRLQSLFEKTKIVCFGRFVIQIPATATVVFGPAEAGPEISYLPGDGRGIARHLARNLAEVEDSREFLDSRDIARLPLFGKVIDGIVPGQKIVIDSKDGVGYYINSYVPIGEGLFVQHVGSLMHQDYDARLFNDVAKHLRLRGDDEIPAEPGTCIAGGFLPISLEYERVTIGVRLKEFPDVHLSVEVHKNQDRLDEGGRLELMLKDGEESAKRRGNGDAYARIKTFRRGDMQLGVLKGYEMVARKPAYKDDTDAHEFRFQSLGAVHDPLQPRLDIRLDTGVKNNRTARTAPSITDEEAIALWDKLIGTIRVRQTADAKQSQPIPAKVPLGKLTATGDLCTQKGWWQCVEGDNIEGGRRRHFVEGESLPHVVLLGKPNLWQRLSGNRPKHTTTTVWKLVDYDDVVPASSLAEDVGTSPQTAATTLPLIDEADNSKAMPPSIG